MGQPLQKPSFGTVISILRHVKDTKSDVVRFLDYQQFDFRAFKPLGSPVDSGKVSVGCDRNGEIRKIIVRTSHFLGSYCLLVRDLGDCRVLLLQYPEGNSYRYTATAVLTFRNLGVSYMINVVSQFDGKQNEIDTFSEFPVGDLNQISCVMRLDEDLQVRGMFKLSNAKVVLQSSIKYEEGSLDVVDYEILHFFVDAPNYSPDLKVSETTLLDDLFNRNLFTESNMVLYSRAAVYEGHNDPIWIYNGTHRYLFSKSRPKK